MAKLNILVTGIGAIIGYGIVNSLRMTGRKLNIIGMDIYADAVGQHFCDCFIQAKRADSPDYLNFLLEVIKCHHIDLVFFGTEQELYRVSDSRSMFSEYLDRLVLNSSNVVDLSKDKLNTHLFLCQNGFDTIPTLIDGSYASIVRDLGSPFILKLRRSYASKGIFKINDEQDFNYWKEKSGGDFILQEIVGDEDHEYTVAVFGEGKKSASAPFVLRRRLSGEGATAKAIVDSIPELSETVASLVNILDPVGPTNLQFRRHKDKYLLLEINPRISSSTSIRAAFGYNEAEMCIRHYVEKGSVVISSLQSGSAFRYISDWIIYEDSSNI